ncbi:uncharacterized protein LOC109540965 [Dendroctonus ponderosae]|uniref:Tudor domain-containing protein n=1 Tax=Dendroctonus ponderosae TaxID=77166 RepID=A0AAR5PVS7_DENPD|nr:uncharacterized protein LOC109540965 [Dendroctonus ponderosae]KAH1023407.1 hypothetical protein HUJ04_012612 [Dendroctonus ponderosae]KAH1029844.1 hypothetical protein HUJ05_003003 [Dendroctonus ponderosae]
MLIVKSQDSLVERNNALNTMVNTETPEDMRNTDSKDIFQYQLPRMRASYTLTVAPDSTTADLPEPANSSMDAKVLCNSESKRLENASLAEYEPHLSEGDPLKYYKPTIPAQPTVISTVPKSPKPIMANKSTTAASDDKDFEIPLEESLRAVEDFIRKEKELSKWQVGEDVLAKWKGNGRYYKAKILEIIPTGTVVVVFESYEVTDELDYKDLCKYFNKTNTFKKKGCPQVGVKTVATNVDVISVKKRAKVLKQKISQPKRLPYFSVFRKSNMTKKKLMYFKRKIQILRKLKSKRRAAIKNNS